jgi:hypothetical protein
MNKEEIFAAWSPETSIWSRWAKPVLFAHIDMVEVLTVPVVDPGCDVSWFPSPQEKAAIVLVLPGEEGVFCGLALAARGYRPVPLYNAVPLPSGVSMFGPSSPRYSAAVNILPIMSALATSAERLVNLEIPSDAPPVFLLDADRQGDGRTMLPNEFDNRSVCFTTDFPSANFLLAQGIQRVVLIQKNRKEPRTDLAHILRRWQDGGLTLERLQLDFPARPEPFVVARPSWYGAMFQRALAAFGLRRARGGGFGAWVPDASGGG